MRRIETRSWRVPARKQVTVKTIQRQADQLADSMRAVLSFETGNLPRTSMLSREWNLEMTLCSRICGALKFDDSMRVLHRFPAPGSLLKLLDVASARGIDRPLVDTAREQVRNLEEVIQVLGGKKSDLDTVVGSHVLEAREKVELSSRQAQFKAMSSLIGIQAETTQSTRRFAIQTPSPMNSVDSGCSLAYLVYKDCALIDPTSC